MSILTPSDFYTTTEYYHIPTGSGTNDAARLSGVISESEFDFCELFEIIPVDITGDKLTALKYFTFAFWLHSETIRKTAAGVGAKNRLKQATDYFDRLRYVKSYNKCCLLMDRQDLKLLPIFNF